MAPPSSPKGGRFGSLATYLVGLTELGEANDPTKPKSIDNRNVSAPVETGEVLRAEMPCAEGLATHGGSESCVNNREVRGEALTGVCAGLVLSRERRSSGCRRS